MPYLSSRIKSQVPFIYFFMASDMSLMCMGFIHTSGFSEQISLSVDKLVKNEKAFLKAETTNFETPACRDIARCES